jgi:hypothetical protein
MHIAGGRGDHQLTKHRSLARSRTPTHPAPPQVVRTETSELSASPDFLNHVLLLRLPHDVLPPTVTAAAQRGQGGAPGRGGLVVPAVGASLPLAPPPAVSLQCSLFASPTMDSEAPGGRLGLRKMGDSASQAPS